MGPSVINNDLLEVKINVYKCRDIGKTSYYPSLVTRPVKDILGMGPSVDMIVSSLDPWIRDTISQFDTFRRSLSNFSTSWKASVTGFIKVQSTGEYPRIKVVLTKWTTQMIWFEQFFMGVELKLGEKDRPYHNIIIEDLKILI